MIARRKFLGVAAVAPSLIASRSGFSALAAAASLGSIKARHVGKVEIVFKSPNGSQPNGLQATAEGLWIMDQAAGNKAYLVAYDDGRVLRSFETETDRSSGITFENGTLWIGSTYSREIVHCDATTGKTISRNFTPGAGVIYKMVGDPAARSSPLAKPRQRPPQKAPDPIQAADPSKVGGFQAGQLLGSRALGTGAHGQEWRDGKLWMAVPPARMVYRVDPKEWIVEKKLSDGRQSSAWHRLGRQVPVGGRLQSERLLQARSRHRRDGGEDSARRFRSVAAWHEHPRWLDVVLRRRGRGLPAEAVTRNATITRLASRSRR